MSSKVNEGDLVRRCLEGEPTAVAILLQQFIDPVRGFLQRKGAPLWEAREIAGDLAAECLAPLRGGRRLLEQYDGVRSLQAWMSTIALRRLIDRRRRVQPAALGGNVNAIMAPSIACGADELAPILHAAIIQELTALSPEAQVILTLVFREGLSQRQIASVWKWHETKVSRFIKSTCADLRSRLLDRLHAFDSKVDWEDEDLELICGGSGWIWTRPAAAPIKPQDDVTDP